jgi:hypothetical protein
VEVTRIKRGGGGATQSLEHGREEEERWARGETGQFDRATWSGSTR